VSNTPTLREQRETHDRRARIIDQLHAQATATADYRTARRGKANAPIAEGVWRRRGIALCWPQDAYSGVWPSSLSAT
jgi:hypothetical protein